MKGQMEQILIEIETWDIEKGRKKDKCLVIKTKSTQILYMVLKLLT